MRRRTAGTGLLFGNSVMFDGITEKQKEVVDYILTKIMQDGLLPGDKLDTEIAIAKNISITRATVREATRILIEQQRIYRVKGSGLFVGSIGKSNHAGRFHALSPFDYQAHKKAIKRSGRCSLPASSRCPDRRWRRRYVSETAIRYTKFFD